MANATYSLGLTPYFLSYWLNSLTLKRWLTPPIRLA